MFALSDRLDHTVYNFYILTLSLMLSRDRPFQDLFESISVINRFLFWMILVKSVKSFAA